jgi:methyl-accepting chemotaxis protein
MDQPKRTTRRITVIPGSFQTRYVVLTACFFGSLSLLIFLDFKWFIQDSVLVNPTRPDLALIFENATWTFYLRFVLYMLSLVFFLYVLFHRLAGPVLRFSRLAKSVTEGDLTQRVSLRNHDGLKDLQIELNRMTDSLAETVKTDRAILGNTLHDLGELQNQNIPPEVRTKLQAIQLSLSTVLTRFKL